MHTIIIEVRGGVVNAVYANESWPRTRAFVVDYDGAQVGEQTEAAEIVVEKLRDADKETFDAATQALKGSIESA